MFNFVHKNTEDKNLRQFQEIGVGEPFLFRRIYFMKTSEKEAVPLRRFGLGREESCVHKLPLDIEVKRVTLEVTDTTE